MVLSSISGGVFILALLMLRRTLCLTRELTDQKVHSWSKLTVNILDVNVDLSVPFSGEDKCNAKQCNIDNNLIPGHILEND